MRSGGCGVFRHRRGRRRCRWPVTEVCVAAARDRGVRHVAVTAGAIRPTRRPTPTTYYLARQRRARYLRLYSDSATADPPAITSYLLITP